MALIAHPAITDATSRFSEAAQQPETVPHPFLDNANCQLVRVDGSDYEAIDAAWPIDEPYRDLAGRLVIGMYTRFGFRSLTLKDEEPRNVVLEGDVCELCAPAWWAPIRSESGA